jgi:UrcA family protein
MTTMTRTFPGRAAAFALAATFTAFAAGTASATTPAADVPSATVRFGDLNLATEQGARTLYRRIAMVAKQVCPDGGSRDLSRLAHAQACQKQAIERAVREVNSPHLAAAYAKSGRQG